MNIGIKFISLIVLLGLSTSSFAAKPQTIEGKHVAKKRKIENPSGEAALGSQSQRTVSQNKEGNIMVDPQASRFKPLSAAQIVEEQRRMEKNYGYFMAGKLGAMLDSYVLTISLLKLEGTPLQFHGTRLSLLGPQSYSELPEEFEDNDGLSDDDARLSFPPLKASPPSELSEGSTNNGGFNEVDFYLSLFSEDGVPLK